MENLPYYNTSAQPHVGSGGFLNYFGRVSADEVALIHKRIGEAHGPCVIVDGSDDWSAKPEHSVFIFLRQLPQIKPLALYHSGISGITKSGRVFSIEDFNTFAEHYRATFGYDCTEKLKVYPVG